MRKNKTFRAYVQDASIPLDRARDSVILRGSYRASARDREIPTPVATYSSLEFMWSLEGDDIRVYWRPLGGSVEGLAATYDKAMYAFLFKSAADAASTELLIIRNDRSRQIVTDRALTLREVSTAQRVQLEGLNRKARQRWAATR